MWQHQNFNQSNLSKISNHIKGIEFTKEYSSHESNE
jgi:hypothetical protein